MFGLRNLSVRNASNNAILSGAISRYDVALSQIEISPERATAGSVTVPYFNADQSVLMRAGRAMTSLAQARKAKWGVQVATPGVALLKRIGVRSPRVFRTLGDASAALQAGRIDAFVADTAINFGLAKLSNGALKVVSQFRVDDGPGTYRGALPKGSTNVAAVNAVFQTLRRSGELERLRYANLGADPGSVPLLRVPIAVRAAPVVSLSGP
jgi:polar amino acid transport system substrate-binding protein